MLKVAIVVTLFSVVLSEHVGYNYHSSGEAVHSQPQSQPQPQHHKQLSTHHETPHAATPEYVKNFYYFSAPEEKFDQSEALKKAAAPEKKNLQVIFIKTPENKGYEKAVKNLVQNTVEEKTDIYVLTKEPDYAGLRRKIQAVQQSAVHHKPEVNFVKYRTPAEAEHAQQSIVQQYEKTGGKSIHIQGGTPKVLDFVMHASNGAGHAGSTSADSNVNQAYLPPRAETSTAVERNYAQNFLPSGPDVVPGTSYIPLVLRK